MKTTSFFFPVRGPEVVIAFTPPFLFVEFPEIAEGTMNRSQCVFKFYLISGFLFDRLRVPECSYPLRFSGCGRFLCSNPRAPAVFSMVFFSFSIDMLFMTCNPWDAGGEKKRNVNCC
jgi:hypothetical protein